MHSIKVKLPHIIIGMAEPVRKSYRMLPCHCPICFGKLRDVRTVRSHHSVNHEPLVDNVGDVNYTDTTEEDYTAQDDALPYTSISNTSDLDNIREENMESNIEEVDESTHYNIVISEKRLVEFMLKDVKCKLEYGSSQAEIEKHLCNAADLLGQVLIPHKWQDVLKLLRKIGYNDPTHYKVCCERDHTCLFK